MFVLLCLRSIGLVFVLLTAGAGSAFAQECGILFAAQNLEAQINNMREDVPRGDPGTQLQPMLTQLFTGAANLDENDFTDPDLAFSVRQYQISIADISHSDFERPVAVAHLLRGSRHRVLLRRMMILARDICDGQPQQQAEFGKPSATKINWGIASVLGFLFAAAVGVLLYLTLLRARKRKLQLRRHYCKLPVAVELGQNHFSSEIVDISALGAKIKKLDAGDLKGKTTVTFGDHRLTATVKWQNAHFFGVEFEKALRLRQVRALLRSKEENLALKQAAG